MILKTDDGNYIMPEEYSNPTEHSAGSYYCWGYRWNMNEKKFSRQCIAYTFSTWQWVDESELPRIEPLEVDQGLINDLKFDKGE